MFKLMDKKIITVYTQKVYLSGPMVKYGINHMKFALFSKSEILSPVMEEIFRPASETVQSDASGHRQYVIIF